MLENVLDFSTCPNPPCIKVNMAYIPNLSVNHYKYRGRFTRPEVRAWMDDLGWIVKWMKNSQELEFKPPIIVRIDAWFNLASAPDIHNLHKVIGDAIEGGLGIDDKDYRFEDGDVVVQPRIVPVLVIAMRGSPGQQG